jgi:hypothetical protein
MSGGGRSTEPIPAGVVVAGCDVGLGTRVVGGDVEGPVSHEFTIRLPSEGCGSPRGATGLAADDRRAARAASIAATMRRLAANQHTKPADSTMPVLAGAAAAAAATARLAEWQKSEAFTRRPTYSGRVTGSMQAAPVGVNPWRMAGRVAPVEGWCQRPSKMRNVFTGEEHLSRCKSARPSVCAPCAEVKRKDVASIARSGWTDRPTDRGYWCALTAPGVALLPFDRSLCTHSPTLKCSGRDLGCQVEAEPLALWHALLPGHWTHFVTALRRLLNPGLSGPPSSWPVQVEFVKTYEPQDRGALHAHFMVRVIGVCTDAAFQAAFAKAADQNVFGQQMKCEMVDLSNPLTVARCAGYCAKYSTKSSDALPHVRRVFADGSVCVGGLRSWSASRHWGETMKSLHQRRRAWAVAQRAEGSPAPAGVPGPGAAGALDSYQGIYAKGPVVGPVMASGFKPIAG